MNHTPDPIHTETDWVAHCSCEWRDEKHHCEDRAATLVFWLDHMAAIPQIWVKSA